MEANSTQHPINTVAEVQLIYKTNVKPSMRPKVNSSRSAYQVLVESWDQDRIEFVEQFKILLVNMSNKVFGVCEICTGGVAATYVDVKLVMVAALKANATGIILSHNHPSGNLQPSFADKEITNKISKAAQILDMRILDHIIVTPEGYFSFKDEGLLQSLIAFYSYIFNTLNHVDESNQTTDIYIAKDREVVVDLQGYRTAEESRSKYVEENTGER